MLLLCVPRLLPLAAINLRNKNDWDTSNGNGWNQRLPYICGLIRTNFFDIIGTQEVLNSQLNDLLKGLPEYNYIGVARDDGKTQGEYAAIFYRKSRLKLLEMGISGYPRSPTAPIKVGMHPCQGFVRGENFKK